MLPVSLINFYREFYIQLFGINCEKCGHGFLYLYHSLTLNICPNCNQEYCKYCLEIIQDEQNNDHDGKKCNYRYTILYFVGLLAFLVLYLKFVFVCNSNYRTKYLTVTFFFLEYIFFYNQVDNILTNFISIKNIILGMILLVYYDEQDILIYLIVGIIQLICIVFINLAVDLVKKTLRDNRLINKEE